MTFSVMEKGFNNFSVVRPEARYYCDCISVFTSIFSHPFLAASLRMGLVSWDGTCPQISCIKFPTIG